MDKQPGNFDDLRTSQGLKRAGSAVFKPIRFVYRLTRGTFAVIGESLHRVECQVSDRVADDHPRPPLWLTTKRPGLSFSPALLSHVACPSPSSLSITLILLCPCCSPVPQNICRQYRHHLLLDSPT